MDKTTFVFAGGGSLGAIQVGMLKALTRAGIRPDEVIGASAGAINAAYFAKNPGIQGALRLEEIWLALRRKNIFPFTPWRSLLGALGYCDSLVSSSALQQFISRELGYHNIEDAQLPLHIVATDVNDGREVTFSRGEILPVLLASTAIPGVFAPVQIDDHLLIDGSVANHTPISTAIAFGATRVIVLPTGTPCTAGRIPHGPIFLAVHALNLVIARQLVRDAAHYATKVDLIIIPPLCPLDSSAYNFSNTAELIARAQQSTTRWLESGGLQQREIPQSLVPHQHRA